MNKPDYRVIDLAYAAAAGETRWDEVVSELAGLVGAPVGAMFGGDFKNGAFDFHAAHGGSGNDLLAYASFWYRYDPWTPLGTGALAGRVCHGWQAIPDRDLARTVFYSDFGRALGLHQTLGALASPEPGLVVGFGLHRPAGADPFTEDERRRLDRVMPHLRRAVQLSRRLAGAAAKDGLGFAALDALAAGVVLIGADGLVVHANEAAQTLARAKDGIALGTAGERRLLEATHPGDRTALRAAIQDVVAAGGAGAALNLRRPSSAAPLVALVSPVPSRFADAVAKRQRLAAVFLSPLDAPGPAPEILESLFGFGSAEARVVAELAAGATAQTLAKKRGVSEATVRTQVRRALEKAGAGNLRQLTRMVALAGVARR